ncbi:MAG: ORF6N domain-containing protein, partial [Steroidobacteraceae bacterium]
MPHLAAIYGVTTGRLNEAVKRNAKRFPEDFMFQLSREETEGSRSHFAILNEGRGSNVKYLPHAFTEHGAIQAANVLNSPRAVAMSVYVVRA